MDYENLTPQYRIEEYLEAIVEGWAEATQYPYPDYPSWRIEEFLDAFITYIWEDGDHPRKPCPEPAWRLEECLRAIYDVMTGAATPWAFPTPTNRIEEYLAAIHAYLADNTELPVPEPVWRIEQWLAYVLEGVKQGGGIEKTVSGTMVHITDALAKAALSVLASIEPIQDLHGYDHPWPAGGGINKAKLVYKTAAASTGHRNLQDNSVTVYSSSTTAGYRYAQFALLDVAGYAGQTLTFTAKAQQVTGSSTPRILGRLYDSNGSSVGSAIFEKTGTSITHTFTLPATIDSGVTFRVSLYCNSGYAEATETNFYDIQVEVGSTAHDFAPYENICPISGRTGLSVYRTGKNLLDANTYVRRSGYSKPTAETSGNKITLTNYDAGGRFVGFNIQTIVGQQYTVKHSARTNVERIHIVESDTKPTSWLNGGIGIGVNSAYSYTATKPWAHVWVEMSADNATVTDLQFQFGSTATTYEPYNGNTYAVDWTSEAGTVYGGHVNPVTGVLTVDRASVDLGTLNWSMIGSTNKYFQSDALIGSIKPPVNSSTLANAICEEYKCVTWSDPTYESGRFAVNGDPTPSRGKMSFINTNYASAADFKTAMSGIKLVYELATPLTYQLTAQEVQMLLGENYVWASSGDTVSVTYYAEGNANPLQSLNILLGGNYSNPKTADDVSDREALEIILGGNK